MKKHPKKDPFRTREAEKYKHPIPSREYILSLFKNKKRPLSRAQLLRLLRIKKPEELEGMRRRLSAMLRDGQLFKNRRGHYCLPEKMELLSGEIQGHRDGYGFVIPDDGGEDLFINAYQMRSLFHGDRVLVREIKKSRQSKKEGLVVEILERAVKTLVGKLYLEAGTAFVEPIDSRISQTITIPPDELNNAKAEEIVVVEIIIEPSARSRSIGKIVKILGNHLAPGMEIDVAIYNHKLPHQWSQEIESHVDSLPKRVTKQCLQGREDLRALPFVTIDGEDAKDFDDAVYAEPSANGWTLFVAIADVGHYVKTDDILDKEACLRGNSVYFPGHVIPMLPKVLSNGICSLKPNVDRLAMVSEMVIGHTGTIKSYKFYPAVINSHARLTYTIAFDVITDKPAAKYAHLQQELINLYAVYEARKQAREMAGSLDFEIPETRIVFNNRRKIKEIKPRFRNDAHKIIEECMLAANICAAKFLLQHKCHAMFRIHEKPTVEKLQVLREFLTTVGLKLAGRNGPSPLDYANLLNSISERPDKIVIQNMLLRSMQQAVYHHISSGHFALGFEHYTHFTSPIRRYPDLTVHRVIKNILQNSYNPKKEQITLLKTQAAHCSMAERRADDATREVIEWLKCEFMLDKVGMTFNGIISSVVSFGFFVTLQETFIDGLVHISTLDNDYYHFDPASQSLSGDSIGKLYKIGDAIKVKVVRVNLDERQIDFFVQKS